MNNRRIHLLRTIPSHAANLTLGRHHILVSLSSVQRDINPTHYYQVIGSHVLIGVVKKANEDICPSCEEGLI